MLPRLVYLFGVESILYLKELAATEIWSNLIDELCDFQSYELQPYGYEFVCHGFSLQQGDEVVMRGRVVYR